MFFTLKKESERKKEKESEREREGGRDFGTEKWQGGGRVNKLKKK